MNGIVHLKHSVKLIWKRTAVVCIAVVLFQLLFIVMATTKSIKTEMLEDIDDIPPIVNAMIGDGFREAIVKYGILTFGYLHPFFYLLFIVFVFLAVSQMITSEVSAGTIGFTLSRPISRKQLYFNLSIIIFIGLAAITIVSYLTTYAGIRIFHSKLYSMSTFSSLTFNLFILIVFISGYIMLVSSFSDSGKNLFTYAGILIFVFYVLDFLTPLWSPLEYIAPINPFSYYRPIEIMIGQRISAIESIVIILITFVLYYVSASIFSRRDLPHG